MDENKRFRRSNNIRVLSSFLLIALLLFHSPVSHAGQRVNLLISGDISKDYVRGVDSGSTPGYGVGLSLSIPSVATGLFNKSGGSGGAKGSIGIDLDFGLEVGIFYAQEHVNFNSNALDVKVVRIPAIFWLQINRNVWFGVGAHYTQNQQPLPAGFDKNYMGALAALRFNFFDTSSTGFALEARYLHGLQNTATSPLTAQVDGIEALLSIRFGRI